MSVEEATNDNSTLDTQFLNKSEYLDDSDEIFNNSENSEIIYNSDSDYSSNVSNSENNIEFADNLINNFTNKNNIKTLLNSIENICRGIHSYKGKKLLRFRHKKSIKF